VIQEGLIGEKNKGSKSFDTVLLKQYKKFSCILGAD
jgi:hypothetical protein